MAKSSMDEEGINSISKIAMDTMFKIGRDRSDCEGALTMLSSAHLEIRDTLVALRGKFADSVLPVIADTQAAGLGSSAAVKRKDSTTTMPALGRTRISRRRILQPTAAVPCRLTL